MRHPALHLVPDFCSVQPHFQLYKTGMQEWPNWVLSQAPALNPQLLAVGLAVPGPPPGGGTVGCHAEGARAGIALLRATQPVSSRAAHPAPTAAPGLAGCFPLRELSASGAKWLLPQCPGSGSICRDGLGTAGAFVLKREKAKHPDLEKKKSRGDQGLLSLPEMSMAWLKGGRLFLQRNTGESEAEHLLTQ